MLTECVCLRGRFFRFAQTSVSNSRHTGLDVPNKFDVSGYLARKGARLYLQVARLNQVVQILGGHVLIRLEIFLVASLYV